MATCPSNHESQTADFCSVCGIEMNPATQSTPSAHSSTIAASPCPICQTPRSSEGGDFCEECGYNFKTGTTAAVSITPEPPLAPAETVPQTTPVPVEETLAPEPQPTAAAPAAPESDEPPTLAGATATTVSATWEVVVSVDPSIRGTPAADAPAGYPDRLYPLDGDKTIGRKSHSKNFTPDIDLTNDTAISHQQAKLTLQSNGEVTLVDLDSANGTLLNKVKIPPKVLHLLKDGDVIAIGGWTKIVVRKTNK